MAVVVGMAEHSSPYRSITGERWKGGSDRFAQTLCDTECNLLCRFTGFDLDLLARGRVAPLARRACRSNSYLQGAKVGDADFAALLQHATDVGHKAGEHLDRLLLGYSVIIACPLSEMVQRNDRRQWPGHRSGFRSRRRGPFLVGRLCGDQLYHGGCSFRFTRGLHGWVATCRRCCLCHCLDLTCSHRGLSELAFRAQRIAKRVKNPSILRGKRGGTPAGMCVLPC